MLSHTAKELHVLLTRAEKILNEHYLGIRHSDLVKIVAQGLQILETERVRAEGQKNAKSSEST